MCTETCSCDCVLTMRRAHWWLRLSNLAQWSSCSLQWWHWHWHCLLASFATSARQAEWRCGCGRPARWRFGGCGGADRSSWGHAMVPVETGAPSGTQQQGQNVAEAGRRRCSLCGRSTAVEEQPQWGGRRTCRGKRCPVQVSEFSWQSFDYL
jgi:hypothetical protein